MSGLDYPYTPEQITEAIGELKAPEEMSTSEHFRVFWEQDPIELTSGWGTRAWDTIVALRNGVDVVIQSGRNGTGKTLQFGRALERGIAPKPLYIDDAYPTLRTVDRYTEPGQVVIADELTHVLSVDPGMVASAIDAILRRNQLVAIVPSPNKEIRMKYVNLFQEIIKETAPDSTQLVLEDVSSAQLNLRQAGALLRFIGAERGVIELLDTVPALRAPRLFHTIFKTMSCLTRIEVETALLNWIYGFCGNKVIDLEANMGTRHQEPHGPFTTTSLSTHEAIGIYEALGVPLPDESELNAEYYGFNPFDKN